MKTLFSFFVCFAFLPSAFAGGSTIGNGGDELALEFSGRLDIAWAYVANSRDAAFAPLAGLRLEAVLPLLKIVTVDTPLETDIGTAKQESAAVNFPENQLILFNRARWTGMKDSHVKEGLALHEALSLLGKESSGKYPFSAAYLAAFGLSAGDLEQKFAYVDDALEYTDGPDLFRIEARERFDDGTHDLGDLRIDYTVKRNGKILRSFDDRAGLMWSCSYDANPADPSTLPKHFLRLAGTPEKTFGFFVEGLGICGNTTSLRVQLIRPRGKSDYVIQEFVPKTRPRILERQGRAEIWFIDQVWGNCGTAGSFFVPNLLTLDEYGRFSQTSLPIDPSQIPTFEPFTFDLFRSYYVNGMRTRKPHLLERAALEYLPELGGDYQACGFPGSPAEVRNDAAALSTLGNRMDLFGRSLSDVN